MTVETVPGTGHTVFRDDHAGFMDAVMEWLRGVAPSPPVGARSRRVAAGARDRLQPIAGARVRGQTERSTATTLPSTSAWSPRIGSNARVAGEQPGVAVALAEHLDGRLAVEHRRDDLAVLGRALRAHDDPVAVADGGIDHRVADDLQHEQLALADELAGEREDLVDLLLGGDRDAGRDASDERHHRGVADRDRVARGGLRSSMPGSSMSTSRARGRFGSRRR